MTYPRIFLLVGALLTASLPFPIAESASSASDAAWLSPDWHYRQTITIEPTKAGENLANFSVAIKITNPAEKIFTEAKADGSDIRLTSQDGLTILPHEIEIFQTDPAELVLWVNVPELSSTTPTTLYLYFGHPTAPAPDSSAAAWDSEYTEVFLMNELSSKTAGHVGTAATFTGPRSVIDLGHAETTNLLPPFTISAWIKPTSLEGTIVGKRDGDQQQWQFFTYGAGTLQIKEDQTGRWPGHQSGTSETTITRGQWQHVAVTIDAAGTPTFYKNGVSEAGQYTNGTFRSRPIPAALGARWADYPNSSYHFTGDIDDVRLSKTNRSAAWLRTEYKNQSQPEQFLSLGLVNEYSSVFASTADRSRLTSSLAPLAALAVNIPYNYYPLLLFTSSCLLLVFLVIRLYRRLKHRPTAPPLPPLRPASSITTIEVKQEH